MIDVFVIILLAGPLYFIPSVQAHADALSPTTIYVLIAVILIWSIIERIFYYFRKLNLNMLSIFFKAVKVGIAIYTTMVGMQKFSHLFVIVCKSIILFLCWHINVLEGYKGHYVRISVIAV